MATPPARASDPSPGPLPSPGTGDTQGCVVCHGLPDIVRTDSGERPALNVSEGMITRSAHTGLACTDCHSPLTGTGHPTTDRAPAACGGCHSLAGREWGEGAHGRPSGSGPMSTCVTCHGSHEVAPAGSEAFMLAMAEECASCHRKISEYGFASNPLGMETHLGRMDVATCNDCHEAHDVRPQDDPESLVSAENRLETCQTCHMGATANFAEIQVHVASGPLPEDPRLRLATLWMLLILIVTFAFFGWLTALGIRHEWRATHRPRAEGG